MLMMIAKQIFETVRAGLELGYYAAGIILAYLAYRGLAQINLTKQIATTNAKRESFKLAVEQCHFYAEQVVPARAKVISAAKDRGVQVLSPESFVLAKGEIVEIKIGKRHIGSEAAKLSEELLLYMNRLEAFAMAFTSGVADETVGYRETAQAFCQTVPEALPYIQHCRLNNLSSL